MSLNVMRTEYAALSTSLLSGGTQLVAILENPACVLRVVNNSANIIILSTDIPGGGQGAFDQVLANDSLTINLQTNAVPPAKVALLPVGFSIYASSATSSAGLLTVTIYYQANT